MSESNGWRKGWAIATREALKAKREGHVVWVPGWFKRRILA
jgi:hypothetical protein